VFTINMCCTGCKRAHPKGEKSHRPASDPWSGGPQGRINCRRQHHDEGSCAEFDEAYRMGVERVDSSGDDVGTNIW